jgi:hypothetical protein
MNRVLDELLEDIVDNVEDAETNIGDGVTPDLSDTALVAEHIETALNRIETALEVIGDAGAPDPQTAANGLESVARQCVSLAEEALNLHNNGDQNELVAIGDRLKTIRHLITSDDGYRKQAGLE